MKLPRRAGLYIPALLTLAACNVVTDGAPIWDMTWNVPSKSTSISVNTLLPSGVTAVNNLFQASVAAPAVITRTLAQDCPQCVPANGQTAPKPAFTATFSSDPAKLPSSVSSATLVTDTILVTITNGYNFDPIKPGAGNVGSIKLTATSGTATIGTVTLTGATQSIPGNGAQTTIKLPISGAVSSSGIQVSAVIDSPTGDPIVINTNQQLTVAASVKGSAPNTVLISAASVTLNNQSVTTTATNLDLHDIDSSIRKRAMGGKLFLTITNPFAVGGNLTLTITGGASTVTKTVALSAGSANATQTVVVDFTTAEIQSILGYNTNITLSGTVSGTTPVTPGQTVAVATRLQLTLCTESTSENSCK